MKTMRLADFLKEAKTAMSAGTSGTPRISQDGTQVELVSVAGKVLKTVPAQQATCSAVTIGKTTEYTIN
jgi:hypothetical protein